MLLTYVNLTSAEIWNFNGGKPDPIESVINRSNFFWVEIRWFFCGSESCPQREFNEDELVVERIRIPHNLHWYCARVSTLYKFKWTFQPWIFFKKKGRQRPSKREIQTNLLIPPLLKPKKTHSPLHSIGFFLRLKDVMDRSVWQSTTFTWISGIC